MRDYVIQKYGPGYCRNGHDRAVAGRLKDGRCRECKRKVSARQHAKGLGAERARKRAALAVIADPSIIERDIAEMRARVAARKAAS